MKRNSALIYGLGTGAAMLFAWIGYDGCQRVNWSICVGYLELLRLININATLITGVIAIGAAILTVEKMQSQIDLQRRQRDVDQKKFMYVYIHAVDNFFLESIAATDAFIRADKPENQKVLINKNFIFPPHIEELINNWQDYTKLPARSVQSMFQIRNRVLRGLLFWKNLTMGPSNVVSIEKKSLIKLRDNYLALRDEVHEILDTMYENYPELGPRYPFYVE